MVALLLIALSASPDDLPTLANAKASGFESSRNASGTLVKPFCFSLPTRVCVPTGSWVSFSWSVCGPHSNRGCDDRHVTPSVDMVDAAAPIEAYGHHWAAVVHREGSEGERGVHTLQISTELEGQLVAPATIDGVALLPGHTRLSYWVRDRKQPPEEHVLAGVWATARACDGWKLPAGTAFDGVCGQGVTLTAPPGTWLVREAARPGEPTRVRSLSVSTGEQQWRGVAEPVTLLGFSLSGEVTVGYAPDGGYAYVRGEVSHETKAAKPKGRPCVLPSGSQLTLNGDGTVAYLPDHCRD